ncbi:hypothetical protein KCU81_g1782, partial [Aureobasidium melanogenum]
MSDRDDFLARVQMLRSPVRCPDWAAILQDVCTKFWARLDGDGEELTVTEPEIHAFIDILKDPERFGLARLVIPDLRTADRSKVLTRVKLNILETLCGEMEKYDSIVSKTQADFDTPAYRAEKDIMLDVNIYRLKLLLYDTVSLTDAEEEKFNSWWEARPQPRGERE